MAITSLTIKYTTFQLVANSKQAEKNADARSLPLNSTSFHSIEFDEMENLLWTLLEISIGELYYYFGPKKSLTTNHRISHSLSFSFLRRNPLPKTALRYWEFGYYTLKTCKLWTYQIQCISTRENKAKRKSVVQVYNLCLPLSSDTLTCLPTE